MNLDRLPQNHTIVLHVNSKSPFSVFWHRMLFYQIGSRGCWNPAELCDLKGSYKYLQKHWHVWHMLFKLKIKIKKQLFVPGRKVVSHWWCTMILKDVECLQVLLWLKCVTSLIWRQHSVTGKINWNHAAFDFTTSKTPTTEPSNNSFSYSVGNFLSQSPNCCKSFTSMFIKTNITHVKMVR